MMKILPPAKFLRIEYVALCRGSYSLADGFLNKQEGFEKKTCGKTSLCNSKHIEVKRRVLDLKRIAAQAYLAWFNRICYASTV